MSKDKTKISDQILQKNNLNKEHYLYKDSLSNNKFWCNGILITGPDRKHFYGTIAMTVIPSGLFFGLVYEKI